MIATMYTKNDYKLQEDWDEEDLSTSAVNIILLVWLSSNKVLWEEVRKWKIVISVII